MRPLSDQALPRVCEGVGASLICTRSRYFANSLSGDFRFETLTKLVLMSKRQHRTTFMFRSLNYDELQTATYCDKASSRLEAEIRARKIWPSWLRTRIT